ncbi:hypothetical protein [Hyphomicrobium sp.]|uniref:hypothetical protein n=1 Tax=Hyphomicrobium sp. TaxID=82 RepID=UPI0025C64AF7|nr:hypothetical protein [Hyphomicrobium sp.]MCC7254138.1 hypothetical protein [Hyphomicrobium sp.]
MSTFFSRLKSLALVLGLSAGVAAAGALGAAAQEFKQIELTDPMVKSFISAQKDFAPLASKLVEGGESPDAALTKDLEDIAKKHGFGSFAEFEDVGANITLILDGLDRSSGEFTDPIEKMKKELEDIKADESIPAEDKKLAVDDLTQEIAASQPLKFKGNIDVVKKHIAEIEALIPEEAGESGPEEGEPPAP